MSKSEHNEAGIGAALRRFMNEPLPKGVSWPQTLGSVLLALVVVQIVTGILLSLYYSPNADVAYESVQYIEQVVIFGSLIRGLHYFAASAMVLLVFLHMLRTFFFASYKSPRQWTWVLGVALLLIVLGFAFTGYLLPWDMKAYFATKVGINIGGITPFVGKYLVKVLQGGAQLGTLTLSRFFSLHAIVLPIALILVAGLHVYYIRAYGTTPPGLRNDEPVEHGERFYPAQLFRDSMAAFVVIAIILVLAIKFGAPLEEKANPNDTAYIPRPDWYFYALFQLLKIFPGRLEIVGAIVLPGLFLAVLFLLPFFDRNPERRLSRRPVAAGLGIFVALVIVVLTAWGAVEGEKAKAAMAAARETVTVEGEVEDTYVVDPGIGERLFRQLKCGECHNQVSAGDNIPPGLEFAGNKYRQSWLVDYLLNPHRIRWQRKDQRPVLRMPDFQLTEEEAMNLSAYLLTLKKDALFAAPEFDWAQADSEMVLSGAELLAEYSCTGCHVIGDQGQNIGPELTHVGRKLIESYMFHLIQAPERVVPGTAMKNFKLDTEDIEDMVSYLRSLK